MCAAAGFGDRLGGIWEISLSAGSCGRTAWLPAAAATAGFGARPADVPVFALLASQLLNAPGTLAPAPIAAAATASLIRLTLARRPARRCLATCAALT